MNRLVLSVTLAVSVSATCHTARASAPPEVYRFTAYSRSNAYDYLAYVLDLTGQLSRLASDASDVDDRDVEVAARHLIAKYQRVTTIVYRFIDSPTVSVRDARRYRNMVLGMANETNSTLNWMMSRLANETVHNGTEEDLDDGPVGLMPGHL